jgi:pimeloyl-ACP methyl ester carboxylesterase
MTQMRTRPDTQPALLTINEAPLWVERRGEGPEVLLIAGLSDTVEVWEPQLAGLSARYRLTAFDTRGAGRSAMIPEGFTVADMADDAAEILRELGVQSAHIVGFSGGSLTAQELALRHPDLVRSLVLVSTWARPEAYTRRVAEGLRWMMATAPSERAALEAFFVWIYTRRAHQDGLVDQIVEDALAFPFGQTLEGFHRQLDSWMAYDSLERVSAIRVPTLVVAGGQDIITPASLGRAVAQQIPDAEFALLPDEAHQPFQERPEEFNAMVEAFWQRHHRTHEA